MDYRSYKLSGKDEACCIGMSLGLSVLAAWILYRHILGMLLFPVIYLLYRKNLKRKKREMRRQELLRQFSDAVGSVVTALLSGYSLENAWREAEKEMNSLYGESGLITLELHRINIAVGMNQTLEKLIYDFAVRSNCEDILDFAEVFLFAKRSGGNFAGIMKNTIFRIREKISVEQEVETVIAGKKMEQKVMNAVPILLLAYLNLTAGEFLAPLYHNAFGAVVMTLAFLAYVGAFFLSKKMTDIHL